MLQITEEILTAARVVWQYLHLGHTPIPGDVIVGLGTNDLRVAEFAADLYSRGFGRIIVFTGGIAHQNDLLATDWGRSEAEMFAAAAIAKGIPAANILTETRAANTAENVRFTRQLLEQHGIQPANIVLAVKPFMQRRTWATMAVEWPEMPATVASPRMTLDEYFTPDLTPEKIIHIMMGDLQRICVYGRRGWSAAQLIPGDVRSAFAQLKQAGFTRQLIPES